MQRLGVGVHGLVCFSRFACSAAAMGCAYGVSLDGDGDADGFNECAATYLLQPAAHFGSSPVKVQRGIVDIWSTLCTSLAPLVQLETVAVIVHMVLLHLFGNALF